MEYKKPRWEKEYENFLGKNSEELTSKIANINKELSLLKEGKEYAAKKNELAEAKKELAKFKKIDQNRGKIENILSFKKELVEKTAEFIG